MNLADAKRDSILPFVKRHISNATFTTTFLVLLIESEQNGAVKNGMAKNICRDVLADLLPSFRLEISPPQSKRPRHHDYYKSSLSEPQQPDLSEMDATDIANLIDYCRSVGLREEQEALKDHMVTASKTIWPEGFGSFFVPLLTHLVKISERNSIPLNEQSFRPFFKGILDNYVRRYVDFEPRKPSDWAQERRGCGHCGDCYGLGRFLTNPDQKVGRFSMAEKRRRHLEYKLHDSGCTLDTERRGSPYTLVVTKTLKKWQDDHKAWSARCVEAGRSFQAIGVEALKRILQEDFEKCLDLKLESPRPSAGEKSNPAVDSSTRPLPRVPAMNDNSYAARVQEFSKPAKFGTQAQPDQKIQRSFVPPPRVPSTSAWHAAPKREAACRSPLGTLTQANSQAVHSGTNEGKQMDSAEKTQIIDLTSD